MGWDHTSYGTHGTEWCSTGWNGACGFGMNWNGMGGSGGWSSNVPYH